MNRTITRLVLTAGVAAATLTIAVPAHADPIPNGPGTIGLGPNTDPQPQPEPKPVPAGPGDIVNPPKCTHGCGDDQGPQGPKDLANPTPAPADEPTDEPTGVINGGPLHADEPDLDQGCFTGCDLPDEPTAEPTEPTTEAVPVTFDLDKRLPADQLDLGAEAGAQADQGHGINPLFFLLGGAGAGALILAAVARRRRQQAVPSDAVA